MIGPEMKVAELLARYPQVEEPLIARVPAFSKLRNPILRRTVARVTSLGQAARIAGIDPRELILFLRGLVGEEGPPSAPETAPSAAAAADLPWPEPSVVASTIDVRPLLDAGEFPLARVRALARDLQAGRAVVIESPFPPVPLVEALQEEGFACSTRQLAPDRFETAVRRPPAKVTPSR